MIPTRWLLVTYYYKHKDFDPYKSSKNNKENSKQHLRFSRLIGVYLKLSTVADYLDLFVIGINLFEQQL